MEKPSLGKRIWSFPLIKTKHGNIKIENLPWFLFHLTPIAALFVEFHWGLVVLALGLYFARMFAVTGFYHRYFSHRGYTVNSRIVQFLMAFWGATALQQGPIWWASHHRHHHRWSDTEKDLHSPLRMGFWRSHVLWIFFIDDNPDFKNHDYSKVRDLTRYPELLWIDRHYYMGGVVLGVVLFAIGGLPWLIWGLGISTVLLWHGTFTINSLSHVFGKQRFETGDTSRNNLLLAFVTLGEGWHNNHHFYQGGAKAGFYWWEIDITYYGLWCMHKLGLIQKLPVPPERVIETGREMDRVRAQARRILKPGIFRRLSVEELIIVVQAVNTCVDQRVLRKLNLQELRNQIARWKESADEWLTSGPALQPA
ncbi:MAG: acyl-CoA desaturase [Leptospiraceae bacterium]|nr:acyl-CoA desaturase [Leptospiraceae bacterium]